MTFLKVVKSAVAAALMALAIPAGLTPALARVEAGRPQTGLNVVPLTITTGKRQHRFKVEVAASEEQQATGMMFRRRIGPSEGMLFPFRTPRPAWFWMKNTLIPLDMIFIRPDGTIARIAANVPPLTLDNVGIGEPMAAVLEIGGGRAAALGIREGDRVSWRG